MAHLFLSHSSADDGFVRELRDALADWGQPGCNEARQRTGGDQHWGESEPALSPGQWTTLHVALPSHAGAGEARLLSPDAARPVPAFLQVDLEVLQPEQLSDNARLRQHEVWPQDLSGGAWFD
ncbi:MAG: hypothetical protein ACK535_11445, partial [Cyanobacteriota bacterium]